MFPSFYPRSYPRFHRRSRRSVHSIVGTLESDSAAKPSSVAKLRADSLMGRGTLPAPRAVLDALFHFGFLDDPLEVGGIGYGDLAS